MPEPEDSNWGRYAAVGLEVAAGVGLGAAVGYWIDKRFNTAPWGILLSSGVGFTAGMYLFIKEALKANRN